MSGQKLVDDNCVVCGNKWKDRKPKSHSETGAKSIPFIFNMRLFSDKKGNYINLVFCELHGNGHERFTRFKNNILEIKSININRWVKATKVGVPA